VCYSDLERRVTHVADCLSECKDQAEADEFITGCMKASE